jgi:GNAT superfamily N-acetyltransferase
VHIEPFGAEHVSEAARLFVTRLTMLRASVPSLSASMTATGVVEEKLSGMNGVAAVDGDRLAGYLTSWFPIEEFRDTARIGAYSPVWAHGAIASAAPTLYRTLYRSASETWAAERCDVHALTLLANDAAARETWFWSGFGLGTIDAVRPTRPLAVRPPDGYRVRQAHVDDAATLAELDVEHNRHYTTPPVFMAERQPFDDEAWVSFLSHEPNGVWLAEDDGGAFGFFRFDDSFSGSDVTASASAIFCSGAFVRSGHRRRGAATAILDAALRHYRAAGFDTCAVDFEAFNPEAAMFWMRWFTATCFSLMRVPEALEPDTA